MEVAQSYMGQHDIYFTPKVRFGKFLCVIVRNKSAVAKIRTIIIRLLLCLLNHIFFKGHCFLKGCAHSRKVLEDLLLWRRLVFPHKLKQGDNDRL